MTERRKQLRARLEKGIRKTAEVFDALDEAQWQTVLYHEPYPWTVRDLLAHFLSAEEGLLRIAQDIAGGGPGAPDDFDHDAFNAAEQERLGGIPRQQLQSDLEAARSRTVDWLAQVDEADLDRIGRHPALGEVSLETLVNAIYGHQLLHVRDLLQALATRNQGPSDDPSE